MLEWRKWREVRRPAFESQFVLLSSKQWPKGHLR